MRLTPFNNRLIIKHKNECPKLYQFIETKKEDGRKYRSLQKTEEGRKKLCTSERYLLPWKNRSLFLDSDLEQEYLQLVAKYCKITGFPSPYKKVWVETSDGGIFAAYCNKDHEWFYKSGNDSSIPFNTVIRWWYDKRDKGMYYTEESLKESSCSKQA